jgi:hypothetical protein
MEPRHQIIKNEPTHLGRCYQDLDLPPLGVDGCEIFFQKSSGIYATIGGHNESVSACSCHFGGEAQKSNDGKSLPQKAKGKTRDKVTA